MVTFHVPRHYSIPVIEGFFSITHIRNPGVAFGLFAEQESEYKVLFFIIISLIAIIAIIALGPEKLPTAMIEIARFIKKVESAIK